MRAAFAFPTHRASSRRSGALVDHPQALRVNYASDDNIRKRAALFDYAVATDPQTQLFDLFDWTPTATVVDVGCGNGLWTAIASHRTPDGAVIGLDRSAGMVTAVAARPEPILRRTRRLL